jgi:hypothetical protein
VAKNPLLVQLPVIVFAFSVVVWIKTLRGTSCEQITLVNRVPEVPVPIAAFLGLDDAAQRLLLKTHLNSLKKKLSATGGG